MKINMRNSEYADFISNTVTAVCDGMPVLKAIHPV